MTTILPSLAARAATPADTETFAERPRPRGAVPGSLRSAQVYRWRERGPSTGQVTAVDRVVGTSRERRAVAGQPGHQLGDLLRLTESLQRVL